MRSAVKKYQVVIALMLSFLFVMRAQATEVKWIRVDMALTRAQPNNNVEPDASLPQGSKVVVVRYSVDGTYAQVMTSFGNKTWVLTSDLSETDPNRTASWVSHIFHIVGYGLFTVGSLKAIWYLPVVAAA